MFNFLRKALLTACFAAFASQASAMFISPDPVNPVEPNVGTNRYAYSGNDPINRIDPSGYAWIDRAFESVFGDGSFDRTLGSGASERMDQIADRYFGSKEDSYISKQYSNYESSGGILGYDDWRFFSGNLTKSFVNDYYAFPSSIEKYSGSSNIHFSTNSDIVGPGGELYIPYDLLPTPSKYILQGRFFDPANQVGLAAPPGYYAVAAATGGGTLLVDSQWIPGDNRNVIRIQLPGTGSSNAYQGGGAYYVTTNQQGAAISIYSGRAFKNTSPAVHNPLGRVDPPWPGWW